MPLLSFLLVKVACLVEAFWLRSAVCCAKFSFLQTSKELEVLTVELGSR